MRFKHLFQITDTINILGNWKALRYKKVRDATANHTKLSRLGSSEQQKRKKERKKSVSTATGKQLVVMMMLLSGNTVKIYCCSVLTHSVVSNSLRPHGLYPHQAPLSMGIHSLGKNTGVGMHAFL